MPDRIAASDLYRIQKTDLERAIAEFDSGVRPPRFEDSTHFDLLIDGARRFPPKAVVALAAREPLGRILTPDDFSGGESSSAFRLLWEQGFEIATKQMRVGALDATFSISERSSARFLIVESRGPNRNTDYAAGLEALLYGLADVSGRLLDAFVDSARTRHLPIAGRRLVLAGYSYPVHLRDVPDLRELRRQITLAAADTGRAIDSEGGGNPTKRLRLEIGVPDHLGIYALAERLGQETAASVPHQHVFRFGPAPPRQSLEAVPRRAIDPTVIARLHAQMQRDLYEALVKQYGSENISAEAETCSGRPADLIVRTEKGFELFEIKTALLPRDCVRQGIGQLLEYGYWPGSPKTSALWVVGPSALDATTEAYLDQLRQSFALPLGYLHQPSQAESSLPQDPE